MESCVSCGAKGGLTDGLCGQCQAEAIAEALEELEKEEREMIERKFTCPVCGYGISRQRKVTTWEVESLDGETGEPVELESAETSDVLFVEYFCGLRCGWEADEKRWEELYGE